MFHLEGIRRLEEADVARRRVLVRVDLNCPGHSDGSVLDDTKLRAAVPTLRHLLDNEAQVVLIGHRLTPARQAGDQAQTPSLAACGEGLAALLGVEIYLPEQHSRLLMTRLMNDVGANRLLMLENLARDPGEVGSDEVFARRLAEGVEVFVGDCLDAPAHFASIARVPKLCPERVMGFRMEAELAEIGAYQSLATNRRGMIVGGTFAATEGLIRRLLRRGLTLCAGGELGFTLAAASGVELAATDFDRERLSAARTLLALARDQGTEMVLPQDARVVSADGTVSHLALSRLRPGDSATDCGPDTVAQFMNALEPCSGVVFAGGLGLRESAQEANAAMLHALVDSPIRSLVLAGDDLAVRRLLPQEQLDRLAFVSTAGDSLMSLLCGESLPGVECLRLPS